MYSARAVWPVSLIAFALCPSGGHRLAAQLKPQPKLWCAVGVAKPIYQLAETAKLQVSFVVVNDGDAIADPEIGSSHLFINGVEPSDWDFVINNGIRSAAALPEGEVLSFGYELGPRYFAAPGIYTVRWQLESCRSAEMTFRVMPRVH